MCSSPGLGLCLPAASLHLGELLTPCWDFLVSVSAEMCSLKEVVLVSDVHMQGCHSLVILQRLVLLLTFAEDWHAFPQENLDTQP